MGEGQYAKTASRSPLYKRPVSPDHELKAMLDEVMR